MTNPLVIQNDCRKAFEEWYTAFPVGGRAAKEGLAWTTWQVAWNVRGSLAAANDAVLLLPAKTITIHAEGGLVHDVTGIPAGYEVRVEDHDIQDPGDESWDAEKKCGVSVYQGGAI